MPARLSEIHSPRESIAVAYFPTVTLLVDWILDRRSGLTAIRGAPRDNRIRGADHLAAHLTEHSGGWFSGSERSARAELDTYARIELYFEGTVSDAPLLSTLVESFADRGAHYSFACAFEELTDRNFLGYDLLGTGQLSGGYVGKDASRYVPGLYWRTYLHNLYSRQRAVDVEALARHAGARYVHPEGNLLEFGDTPWQWRLYQDRIQGLLDTNPAFFSLSRIRLEERESIPERVRHLLDVCAAWP